MRVRVLLATTLLLLLAGATLAVAQEPLDVRLREAQLDDDGSTQLTVSVTGGQAAGQVLGPESFAVVDGGEAIDDVTVEPLLESGVQPLSVVLVVDVSGSTAGEPLGQARLAASEFVDQIVDDGGEVGLVAFGEAADVRAPLSQNAGRLREAIGDLEASGETALYDGVIVASELLAERDGLRELVVFSDGGDTVSDASLGDALDASRDVGATVTTVALATDELDPASLGRLADGTSGRSLSVEDADELTAAFEQIARDFASQYVLTYTSTVVEPEQIPIAVDVTVGDGSGSDELTALNVRDPAIAVADQPLPRAEITQPRFPVFAGAAGRYTALAGAFVGLALLLGIVLYRPGPTGAERRMNEGLRFYGRGASRARDEQHLPTAKLTERAIELVGRIPKPAGFEERLQDALDRASWPIRANEFLVLQAGAAILGGVVAGGLARSWLFAIVGVVLGAVMPRLIMQRKIRQREKAFNESLASTLQLLAGSLQAGYGLLQAIDTVVQESDPPTSSEFARALTETRLGMPLDEALEGIAERMRSEDFRWVVMSVNIQRQVGGNLAELLGTVAETIRARAQVRRQVQVLSAEGRISAWVVGLMPVVVALILSVLNRGYLNELFTRTLGQILLGVGAVLMVMAIFTLKRIVAVEY